MMGWKCPVCGRGLSPSISVCPCDGQGPTYEYSSTTNPLVQCQHDWRESKTSAAGADHDRTCYTSLNELSGTTHCLVAKADAALAALEAELAAAEDDIEYHKGQAKLWNTALQDALDRAEAAEAKLAAAEEERDKYKWAAEQASEFYFVCKDKDEQREMGDDCGRKPYFWLYELEQVLARYHPETGHGSATGANQPAAKEES